MYLKAKLYNGGVTTLLEKSAASFDDILEHCVRFMPIGGLVKPSAIIVVEDRACSQIYASKVVLDSNTNDICTLFCGGWFCTLFCTLRGMNERRDGIVT